MTKSFSNVLCLKQKLYKLCTREGTVVVEYLNIFNKFVSDLLSVNVKLDEDRPHIAFSFL